MWQLVGAGLGLRRALLSEIESSSTLPIDFFEIAPENWMATGGRWRERFNVIAERYPIACHGLSLSLGGPKPLDEKFLHQLRQFFDAYNIQYYSEHLSYCGDDGHLYDLLPIPFTEEAVHYVANRIRRVQAIIERPIAIENVSYYCAPHQAMTELEFINAILQETGCGLLLDVNNIYVNSINQNYDPFAFLNGLNPKRVDYIHIAGHYEEDSNLLIDTHGRPVVEPVWELLSAAYHRFGILPTLLERDSHFPPLPTLLKEIEKIRDVQRAVVRDVIDA